MHVRQFSDTTGSIFGLSIERSSAGSLLLTWPREYAGAQLQTAQNKSGGISSTADWINLAGTTATNMVNISLDTDFSFFRLVRS